MLYQRPPGPSERQELRRAFRAFPSEGMRWLHGKKIAISNCTSRSLTVGGSSLVRAISAWTCLRGCYTISRRRIHRTRANCLSVLQFPGRGYRQSHVRVWASHKGFAMNFPPFLHHVGIVQPDESGALEQMSLLGLEEEYRGFVLRWSALCIFTRSVSALFWRSGDLKDGSGARA